MNTGDEIDDALTLIDAARVEAFNATAIGMRIKPDELERRHKLWLEGKWECGPNTAECFKHLREVQNCCNLAKLELNKVKPLEMRMCEQNCVVLKPNQVYIFTVDPDCQACKDAAAFATSMNHESKS